MKACKKKMGGKLLSIKDVCVVETENIIMLTECDASLAKPHSISTMGHQFMLWLCHLASTTGFVCNGIFSSTCRQWYASDRSSLQFLVNMPFVYLLYRFCLLTSGRRLAGQVQLSAIVRPKQEEQGYSLILQYFNQSVIYSILQRNVEVSLINFPSHPVHSMLLINVYILQTNRNTTNN